MDSPSRAATIQDVSARAGVSIGTVSNVLNGRHHRMRAETLERVQQAIADLGFRPNESARRLKTGKLPMLGLLVPSIANPFFGALARWVEASASARGYGVLLCNTHRDPIKEREYVEAFMAQGVRGVIVGSALQGQDHLEPMIARGMALVSFDRATSDEHIKMDGVGMDNRRAAAMAVEHLVSLGHRHVAYVGGAPHSVNRTARLKGAVAACRKAGVKLEQYAGTEPISLPEPDLLELGRAAGLQLAKGSATGIVAMNDLVAIGLLTGLREGGRSVPAQVSVVGIDNLFLGQYVVPALTTIGQPLEAMAEAAVERVFSRMELNDEPPQQLVFPPELIIRSSTAPLA